MKKIYIAGPYTLGDVAQNVANAMWAADRIISLGHCPFIPHLFHFQHMAHQQSYEKWLALDLEYLRICDAILRLQGNSYGADIEINTAKDQGIPIFYSIDDIKKYLK